MLKHAYADVNGIRLHYVLAGAGKLILFVHGFPEFWYQWKKQLAEFSRDYLAVAPDLRGYNLSSKPTAVEQYQLVQMVEDLRALAEHLQHKRFVLVGHDWGGTIAWAFALQHPECLEKLIIINAPHPAVFERELRENPAQQRASQYALMFRSPQAEAILSANNYALLVETVLGEGLRRGYFNEEDRKAYLAAWAQPGALTGGLNYYRAVRLRQVTDASTPAAPDFCSELSTLTMDVPTLVIWGEQDIYLLTGNLEGLERYVPDLTIKRVRHGSHWIIHEMPELINTYLREFIQQ